MIPVYTRWRISEAWWIRTRTPVSDRVNPLVVVDILDDPFDDTAEFGPRPAPARRKVPHLSCGVA